METKSREEFEKIKLGEPIRQYRIYDDTIYNYQKYHNYKFDSILIPLDRWIYPVLKRDSIVHCWLIMQWRDGKWVDVHYGGGGYALEKIKNTRNKYLKYKKYKICYITK